MSKAETSKRWFELSCPRCPGRFVERWPRVMEL